jgi:very-short-patch-repair endonuclease
VSVLDDIIETQAGAITRAQALHCGWSSSAIAHQLAVGRWQRLHHGIYAVFSGPVPRECHRWSAILRAGADAVLSHETAAELIGLCEPSPSIHVTIPSGRRITSPAGVVLHGSGRAVAIRHPGRTPPQTRAEETVLDLTQSARSLERAVGWLTKACGQRLTTPTRLGAALDLRKKVRWRTELTGALADVADGCHSVLERRYLHDVERAHGLPRGMRQSLRSTPAGRRYDDVRYDRFGVVVELDGRVAHPDEERWRDLRRDNAATVSGDRVLRYGWSDVSADPCAVAAQVAVVLHQSGWQSPARPCTRRTCVIR